jgi:hypothetical protein
VDDIWFPPVETSMDRAVTPVLACPESTVVQRRWPSGDTPGSSRACVVRASLLM